MALVGSVFDTLPKTDKVSSSSDDAWKNHGHVSSAHLFQSPFCSHGVLPINYSDSTREVGEICQGYMQKCTLSVNNIAQVIFAKT